MKNIFLALALIAAAAAPSSAYTYTFVSDSCQKVQLLKMTLSFANGCKDKAAVKQGAPRTMQPGFSMKVKGKADCALTGIEAKLERVDAPVMFSSRGPIESDATFTISCNGPTINCSNGCR